MTGTATGQLGGQGWKSLFPVSVLVLVSTSVAGAVTSETCQQGESGDNITITVISIIISLQAYTRAELSGGPHWVGQHKGYSQVWLIWFHDDLMMISWWSHDDLLMISWWAHDELMIISWWSHDNLKMIPWWSHDDPMMISWWSHDDLMMILWPPPPSRLEIIKGPDPPFSL